MGGKRRRVVWLVVAVLVLVAVWLVRPSGPRIADGSALVIDLEGSYVEATRAPLVARFLGDESRPLVGLLSELTKAERDDRLGTVIFRVRGLELGWGKAQEIRDAIVRLGAKGRRTVAWLEVDRFGPHLEYYVASAADEVYTAPGVLTPLVGLAGEYLFLGGLFEKLGVEIEYERIGRYKSAVETFAEKKMSEANREMTTALLDSIDSQFLGGIAEARGLEFDAVSEAVDAAPISPAELQERGLIDGALYFDELIEKLGDPPVVEDEVYAGVDPASVGYDPVASVALVYGTGTIMSGEGRSGPAGGATFAAGTVAKAIGDAAEDPEVRGILLRIDSPGGSALASDQVWHAIRLARAQKPVVASFSDVAASGGYYVASAADRIVSQPATYTGSIGVLVLRPVLGGLLEKLGIGVETMTRGTHADLLLSSRSLSPGTRARLRADVRAVYDLFVERVAEGRSLAPEAVDAVGRGRVYTGAQAAELGLVDSLGGMKTALRELKQEIGIDPEADVVLIGYPPPKPFASQILELLGLSAQRAAAAATAAATEAVLGGLADLPDWLLSLGMLEPGAPLLIPPLVPQIR